MNGTNAARWIRPIQAAKEDWSCGVFGDDDKDKVRDRLDDSQNKRPPLNGAPGRIDAETGAGRRKC